MEESERREISGGMGGERMDGEGRREEGAGMGLPMAAKC